MDYYKDGTYRRTIKGTKAKIGDKVTTQFVQSTAKSRDFQ